MKNKNSGGVFIFEDPKEFLKVIEEMQEQYNNQRSNKKGVELNDY